jgi:hypothetical protein
VATYPGYSIVNADAVASAASNLRSGTNPAYTLPDFLKLYPQFTDTLSPDIVQVYIDAASNCISQQRFRSMWNIAISLFVAHFCAIHVQTMADKSADASTVAATGQVLGITTSESVDGVSYSVDTGAIMNDLEGFAGWKATAYGVQLATLAKLYGKGGMMVP